MEYGRITVSIASPDGFKLSFRKDRLNGESAERHE